MPMNVLGMIGVERPRSESTVHIIGGGVDPEYVVEFTKAHEDADFDAVLVGHTSASADGFLVAMHAAQATDRIRFLVAHRPGFVNPTQAARRVATLDQLTKGRVWLHIITGGLDFEQRRDGDFLEHDERYARTDEYLELMRRVWTTEEPFDFDGRFYQAERVSSEVTCWQEPHVPLWFGGISDAAIPVGARHCDMYALFGEPRAEIAALMERIAGVAETYQRNLEFNVSFRPIVADTEEAAWEKARKILAGVEQESRQMSSRVPEAEPARRLVNLIDGGAVQDERLWVPIAAASGGSGNSTALVGTPDQVAEAIVRNYDLGVRGVLIRGFDPLHDTVAYGRELIPAIRSMVAERDASQRALA